MNRLPVLISILLLIVAPALAQKDRSDRKKADGLPHGMLKIPVWVEEGGEFWTGGKKQDFKVFIEEKELPVKSFQGQESESILLVVFDTVADLSRVDEARTALGEAIKGLGDQYWVGLMRAQDGLAIIQEPTPDRRLLEEKIRSIQVSGKAGLLDTIDQVSRVATSVLRKSSVRFSVLYITDSSISDYRADYLNPVINSSDSGDLSRRFSDRAVQERVSRLVETLSEYTVPVFILHLAYREDTLNMAYQSGLERMAAGSGGTAIFCRTSDDIRPSLATLISRIRTEYVIGVDPPGSKRSSVRLRVAVVDGQGRQLDRVDFPSRISLHGR